MSNHIYNISMNQQTTNNKITYIQNMKLFTTIITTTSPSTNKSTYFFKAGAIYLQ